MRKLYLTTYQVKNLTNSGSSKYTSYLLAASDENATLIAKKRGLGEVIESQGSTNFKDVFSRPEVLFDKVYDKPPTHRGNRPVNLLHLTCFLLNVGEVSGRVKMSDFFRDNGLVHQLVHLINISTFELGEDIQVARSQLIELANAAPEMFLTHEEHNWWVKENAKQTEQSATGNFG